SSCPSFTCEPRSTVTFSTNPLMRAWISTVCQGVNSPVSCTVRFSAADSTLTVSSDCGSRAPAAANNTIMPLPGVIEPPALVHRVQRYRCRRGSPLQHRVGRGQNNQCGKCCEHQTADHGPSERRRLLRAFTDP